MSSDRTDFSVVPCNKLSLSCMIFFDSLLGTSFGISMPVSELLLFFSGMAGGGLDTLPGKEAWVSETVWTSVGTSEVIVVLGEGAWTTNLCPSISPSV